MNVQQNEQTHESDGTEHYRPAIDLTVYHKVFRRSDVLIYCTWLRHGGQWEPCLVLVPKNVMLMAERVIPCIVPMSRAHVWDERTGDLQECLINAGIFCANLGFNPFNPKNPLKIIGIIRDLLGDLLTIPPRQFVDAPMRVAAEMEVVDNTTGSVREMEVRDDHGVV